MRVYHAHVDTRSFRFDAYGATRAEALKAMQDGWNIHRAQTGAEMSWTELRRDVQVNRVELGKCYREGDGKALN